MAAVKVDLLDDAMMFVISVGEPGTSVGLPYGHHIVVHIVGVLSRLARRIDHIAQTSRVVIGVVDGIAMRIVGTGYSILAVMSKEELLPVGRSDLYDVAGLVALDVQHVLPGVL